MNARQRFESQAERWDAAGRPAAQLADGYALIALRCWSWSAGAKRDGASLLLQAYRRASEQAQPGDWLDAWFDDRETCRGCGESFRFENVALCTHCHGTWCHRCAAGHPKAANGNAGCPCGGELVG